MPTKDQSDKLEDFRYDNRLFKQAYRAGIKAKEAEREAKRKLQIILFFSFASLLLLVFLAVFISRSSFFTKPSYIKSLRDTAKLQEIQPDYPPSSLIENKYDDGYTDSKAALYADLNTGQILYMKNPNEQYSIASLTKLMSALVALREFELDEEVKVQKDWYSEEDMEWSLGLDKGDEVDIETLLKAMLISSYNDAAYVLAQHDPDGIEGFVEKMNKYAKELGLNSTQFNNPSGLDSNGGNISTVKDLYRLATIIYKNEFISNTLSQSSADLKWELGEEKIYSTNALMGTYGNIFGKTGYTKFAGRCFLGITSDGRVTVVLNSKDSFEESKKLLGL